MVVLKKLERLVHREERRGKGREILEKEQSWIKKIFIKFCQVVCNYTSASPQNLQLNSILLIDDIGVDFDSYMGYPIALRLTSQNVQEKTENISGPVVLVTQELFQFSSYLTSLQPLLLKQSSHGFHDATLPGYVATFLTYFTIHFVGFFSSSPFFKYW